jgi:HEAT repeats
VRRVISEHTGDVIDAEAYSVDELREAVFEGRGRLSRPLALGLLPHKDYPYKLADLERILTSEGEVPRLRAMAASALGEMRDPAAVRVLERGLATEDGVTLRGVAKALAQVGTREHIKSLENLASRPGPLGQDAQRALSVLTERLRNGTSGDPPSLRTVPVERTSETVPIRIEEPTEKDVAEAHKVKPSGRLTRESALSLNCQGRQLLFLFDQDALGRGIELAKSRGEIGMVAEPRKIEGIGWESRYRVSIEPEAQGSFRVIVATASGRVVLAGTGQVKGQEATFHLAAAEMPGALPVDIRGRFDGHRLTLERADSAVRRRAAKVPSRARGTPD